jgi:hypothetical protein
MTSESARSAKVCANVARSALVTEEPETAASRASVRRAVQTRCDEAVVVG